jgi:hypothetical protein
MILEDFLIAGLLGLPWWWRIYSTSSSNDVNGIKIDSEPNHSNTLLSYWKKVEFKSVKLRF